MVEKYFTKTTPFIRPISQRGGTFYTFNSASEDFGLSFSDFGSRKLVFSKFALIKIPEFSDNPARYNENLVRLKAIPGAFHRIDQAGPSAVNLNKYFAESLQNYMLNFETHVLSNPDYNVNDAHTPAEYAFWKWLKELGAIRFQNADNSNTLYKEETESNNYNRIVKYIGDIDVVNNYFGTDNSYFEIYYRIPVDAGKFKNVYFTSTQDNNYGPGMLFSRDDSSTINNYTILGHKSTEEHPISGFSTQAFYDSPYGKEQSVNYGIYLKKYTKDNSPVLQTDFIDEWWYSEQDIAKSYLTESSENYTIPNNEILAISASDAVPGLNIQDSDWTVFKRNTLDGINIDFELNDYINQDFKSNYDSYYSLIDIATSEYASDFEFNAVLIYYDIFGYDPNASSYAFTDGEDVTDSQEVFEQKLATNLFGIYFLDNVNTTSTNDNGILIPYGSGIIPSIQKCVPNEVTQNNGNAFNGRIKFKIDTSPVNAFTKTITKISDGNTLSMDIFADALNEMRDVSNNLILNISTLTNVSNRLQVVESTLNPLAYETLDNRLSIVENNMSSFNDLMNTPNGLDLAQLIRNNNDFIEEIKDGTIFNVNFNSDIFKAGDGIVITKTPSGNLTISSSQNSFNVTKDKYLVYSVDSSNDNRFRFNSDNTTIEYEWKLTPLNNYMRIIKPSGKWTINKPCIINIDDISGWKKGQVMRIYFDGEFELSNVSLSIRTKFILGKFEKEIFNVQPINFNKPGSRIYELICLDPLNYEFIIDILK